MIARRRLFVRSDDRDRFSDVLPWSTLNLLFHGNRFTQSQVRLMQASTEAPPAMYRDPEDWSRLKLDALQTLAAQGMSLVVNGIDALVPSVAAVSNILQQHLRSRRWVNAYLSFRHQSAFRPHWDAHDVVVLHVHGRKRWRSYGMGAAYPTAGRILDKQKDPGAVQWEEVLEPGDVLFLPRGEIHAAEVEPDSASLHLTVGLQPPRGSDVLRWLAKGHDDLLRMDVFPAWDEETRLAHEGTLKETLHRLVDGIDLAAFLADSDRAADHKPAANIGAAFELSAGTWLQAAIPRQLVMPPPDAGVVAIEVAGLAYRVSDVAASLLSLLQTQGAMTLAKAQSALGEARREDVRRAVADLAHKGLIHVVSDGEGRRSGRAD